MTIHDTKTCKICEAQQKANEQYRDIYISREALEELKNWEYHEPINSEKRLDKLISKESLRRLIKIAS